MLSISSQKKTLLTDRISHGARQVDITTRNKPMRREYFRVILRHPLGWARDRNGLPVEWGWLIPLNAQTGMSLRGFSHWLGHTNAGAHACNFPLSFHQCPHTIKSGSMTSMSLNAYPYRGGAMRLGAITTGTDNRCKSQVRVVAPMLCCVHNTMGFGFVAKFGKTQLQGTLSSFLPGPSA